MPHRRTTRCGVSLVGAGPAKFVAAAASSHCHGASPSSTKTASGAENSTIGAVFVYIGALRAVLVTGCGAGGALWGTRARATGPAARTGDADGSARVAGVRCQCCECVGCLWPRLLVRRDSKQQVVHESSTIGAVFVYTTANRAVLVTGSGRSGRSRTAGQSGRPPTAYVPADGWPTRAAARSGRCRSRCGGGPRRRP